MKPILEQIHLGRQQSIMAFRYAKQNFETPWHFHPQHELTYIVQSVGTKFIGDYVGPYVPGELVLLRSKLPHTWKNATEQENPCMSIVVQWNEGIFSDIPELQSVHQMLSKASKGIIFSRDVVERSEMVLFNLPQLEGQLLYVQLLSLLIELSHCAYHTLSENSFTHNLSTEFSNRMSTIYEFVAQHYQRKIYLREVAQLVNMSEQSFCRFFSKMMGRPFFTFLNEYRINIASRMLVDTDWAIAQISFECGYDSLPFFHKQFKKLKSQSPSKFRKKYSLIV